MYMCNVHVYMFDSLSDYREEAFFDLQLNVKGNKSCKCLLIAIIVL